MFWNVHLFENIFIGTREVTLPDVLFRFWFGLGTSRRVGQRDMRPVSTYLFAIRIFHFQTSWETLGRHLRPSDSLQSDGDARSSVFLEGAENIRGMRSSVCCWKVWLVYLSISLALCVGAWKIRFEDRNLLTRARKDLLHPCGMTFAKVNNVFGTRALRKLDDHLALLLPVEQSAEGAVCQFIIVFKYILGCSASISKQNSRNIKTSNYDVLTSVPFVILPMSRNLFSTQK